MPITFRKTEEEKNTEKKLIEQLISEGYTTIEIATKLNYKDSGTICRKIIRYGIERHNEKPDTRICWKCKNEQPLTNDYFSKDKTDKFNFQKCCKECQNKTADKYRDEHPEYFKNKGKERYKKEENKERYQKYRTQNILRASNYSRTVSGKLKQLLTSARGRAKKYNLDFEIDFEFMYGLFKKQNCKCLLTNIDFTFNLREDGRNFSPFNMSIDKINHLKGYTKDNVRLVCVIVNLALNDFGEENFKLMCQSYLNHQNYKAGILLPAS